MVLGETSRGVTRFWEISNISSTIVTHALHDDDADVVDGDLAEALDDGLPVEPVVEPEPALPLGCRWRIPLTRVHNQSRVLLLYLDPLNAQTLDQVMIYVKVYGSIVISSIFTQKFLMLSVNL